MNSLSHDSLQEAFIGSSSLWVVLDWSCVRLILVFASLLATCHVYKTSVLCQVLGMPWLPYLVTTSWPWIPWTQFLLLSYEFLVTRQSSGSLHWKFFTMGSS